MSKLFARVKEKSVINHLMILIVFFSLLSCNKSEPITYESVEDGDIYPSIEYVSEELGKASISIYFSTQDHRAQGVDFFSPNIQLSDSHTLSTFIDYDDDDLYEDVNIELVENQRESSSVYYSSELDYSTESNKYISWSLSENNTDVIFSSRIDTLFPVGLISPGSLEELDLVSNPDLVLDIAWQKSLNFDNGDYNTLSVNITCSKSVVVEEVTKVIKITREYDAYRDEDFDTMLYNHYNTLPNISSRILTNGLHKISFPASNVTSLIENIEDYDSCYIETKIVATKVTDFSTGGNVVSSISRSAISPLKLKD